MTFKTLTLEDRALFRAGEKARPPATSDAVFTNIFIWRSYYRPIWAEAHGCLCLIFQPREAEPFGLPPVGAGDRLAAMDFLMRELSSRTAAPSLRQIPADLAEMAVQAGRPWQSVHDRDNDDYVYASRQLITLGGRRMHQKKNHYNFFVSHNQFECLPITRDLTPDLLAVEESWVAAKEGQNMPSSRLRYEIESVHELLRHMDDLEQSGLAIRISGKIEGFTMGELISPDTALVHVEKANHDIRGLFVALTSHFCREFFSETTYVNREQDLGLPGLRHSKESLKPDHMRRKYILSPA
ncbi:MAG: phosphatidylglycerol lysyltransferase domain-containing protein [Candidatus Adiutrix sp.]|jgi:hypothetical protein|nr:phosphatidylglycerol lysyltransferase domain-containing protein [Candidatus Adiutrix sp.]